MFEHMLFKGTKHVRPEAHAQFLNGLGGYVNAATDEDATHYIDTVPAAYLDFAIQLEAERMRNLLFRQDMFTASTKLEFEKAARLRDEIRLLETLAERGDLEENVQPEVFLVDPKKGLAGLEKVLGLKSTPRVIEGVDIAHLAGNETVASLVQFIDGLPFKPGYKRYRIKTVDGIDDFKSIHEVVSRRFSRLVREGASLPDIFLVDGGKGQLSAALDALESLGIEPPCIISLAKREEEVFLPGKSEPLRLSRDSYSLRLLEYVRDEAHRFAQHYHHLLRGKRTLDE